MITTGGLDSFLFACSCLNFQALYLFIGLTKWFDILNSQCHKHKLKIQFRHYHYKITHLEIQSLQQESLVHGTTCTVQLSWSQLEAGKKMHFHLMESSMIQWRFVALVALLYPSAQRFSPIMFELFEIKF